MDSPMIPVPTDALEQAPRWERPELKVVDIAEITAGSIDTGNDGGGTSTGS